VCGTTKPPKEHPVQWGIPFGCEKELWRCNMCVVEKGGEEALGFELLELWQSYAIHSALALRDSNLWGWRWVKEKKKVS